MNSCRIWLQLLIFASSGLMMLPADELRAQTLKPEKVFNNTRIAKKGIRSASITRSNEFRMPVKETYTFDTMGNYTGLMIKSSAYTDTLYHCVIDQGKKTEITERRGDRVHKVIPVYDGSGRLITKKNIVNDTLYSVVSFVYNTEGFLTETFETGTAGDTLSGAKYIYRHNRLVEARYTGVDISRIEYDKKRNRLTSRVFKTDDELMLVKTEIYRRDRLLRNETTAVAGIKAVPTTRYRYRCGLLHTIIQPDGKRVRLTYHKQ